MRHCACKSVAFHRSVKSDYVSRDVLPWWLLRRVFFASLALFNGHLGILRIPLDTISFKVNLSQRLCHGCLSKSCKSVSWIYDTFWQRCWNDEEVKYVMWNIRVEHEVVFLRLSLLWGFSENVLYLDNYTMLFYFFEYWYICVLHSIFFEIFVFEIIYIYHPSNCYGTKCKAFAFAQK